MTNVKRERIPYFWTVEGKGPLTMGHTLGDVGVIKTAFVIRGAERATRSIDSDNRREIGGGSASENSEAECADLVLDSVLYIEPMELCQ